MDKRGQYCVYMHKNKINNKAYIGITKLPVQKRWQSGAGYCKQLKFYRAILKYGWDNFEHLILEEGILTEKEALNKESYYIKLYNSVENGYNVLENSLENPSYTVQYIPVYCIEKDIYYKSIADATRQLGFSTSGDIEKVIRGERNGCHGLHFLKATEVNENNIKLALQKRTGKFRKIYCIDNKMIFNSLQDAANFCSRTPQSVLLNCKGKRKSCGGYHFQYYEESEIINGK